MVWGKLAARGALAGYVVAGLGGQAAAETMVVRATGPSAATYKPGSKLGDGGSLTLKAGDVVTLLDARGTRTLRGPGSFNVAAAASAAPANNVMLSALLDTKRVRRARTGAVRGTIGETPAAPPRRPPTPTHSPPLRAPARVRPAPRPPPVDTGPCHSRA